MIYVLFVQSALRLQQVEELGTRCRSGESVAEGGALPEAHIMFRLRILNGLCLRRNASQYIALNFLKDAFITHIFFSIRFSTDRNALSVMKTKGTGFHFEQR